MSNVLGLGVPRSEHVALRDPVIAYLDAAYPDVHSVLYESDIEAWSTARDACIHLPIAASSVPKLLAYAVQLAFLLRVLDRNAGAKDAAHTPLGFGFPWGSGLTSGRLVAYSSLAMERACIVQSIAAQYAQLGQAESRSDKESIRRATMHFQVRAALTQYAAGTLQTLQTLLTPAEQGANAPVELAPTSLTALHALMLAQAQECFWQKATQDAYKDTTIAKLARSAADLYEKSANAAAASPLPQAYKVHARCKQLHFSAAAQYRKSCDDLVHKRYGDELGRLTLAAAQVRAALALPLRVLPSHALVDDLRGLQSIVETNLARAERDNQLIYLESATSEAALPDLGTAEMAKAAVPEGLASPRGLIDEHALWFRGLMTYGIDVAERLYSDRKRHFCETVIEVRLRALDAEAAAALAELHLPGMLDRIESPQRIPREWATYTAALQRAPLAALPREIDENTHVAAHCADVLGELEAIVFRAVPGVADDLVTQQHALQTLWREYEHTLAEAGASDATVRAQWEAVRADLAVMERGGAELARHVLPPSYEVERVRRAAAPRLRALRADVERLEDGAAQRRALLQRVRSACDTDVLRPRLEKAARERHLGELHAGAEAEAIDPGALDDVLDAGMRKYTPYEAQCDALHDAQAALLRQIRAHVAAVHDDAALGAALRAQDAAYARVRDAYTTYTTLTQHVHEGHTFYTRLATLLDTLRADVAAWRARAVPSGGAFPGGAIRFGD